VLRRFRRWMQVLRAHRPVLYPTVPLLLAPTPLLLPLAAWLGSPPLIAAVAALVVLRIALALVLSRGSTDAAGAGWEWLVGEAMLLAAWTASLGDHTVDWRGRCFTVQRGGRMARTVPEGDA